MTVSAITSNTLPTPTRLIQIHICMTKVQPVNGGIAIIWQGGNLSTQDLQRRFSLNPTSNWTEIFTNLPPTPNPSGFTNYGLPHNADFYRVRVTR